MIIYINGQFQKFSQAEMIQFAPGVIQGKGVFETMNVINGNILDLQQHLDRLHRGLKRFDISARVTPQLIQAKTKQLLQKNNLSDARLRLSVSKAHQKQDVILVVQKKRNLPKSYRLCLSKIRRPLNAWTHLKSIRYEVFRSAFLEAQRKKYDDALLLNCHGHIVEASSANIFWIKKGTLYTPSQTCGCLHGITKIKFLKKAKEMNLTIQKGKYTLAHLRHAENVYLSNSLIGIKPVSQIENQSFKISQLPID